MGYLEVFSYIMVLVYAIATVVAVLVYVFEGLAMHRIAKLRGIKYPWLAWIPVVNGYNMGRVADVYNERIEGRKTNLRTIILVIEIVYIVLAAVNAVLRFQYFYDAGVGIAMTAIMTAAMVALAVFMYIALYKIYKWCTKNYVLYEVLSIVISITMPFLLFAARNGVNPELTGKEN